MEWVETTGRTVEDAKDAALDQLGVAEDDAEFEVIEEPRSGLFGRTRGEARVRARVRPKVPRPKVERRTQRRRTPGKQPVAAGASVSAAATTEDRPRPDGATATRRRRRRDGAKGAGGENPGASERSDVGVDADEKGSTMDDATVEQQATIIREFLAGLVDAFELQADIAEERVDDETIELQLNGQELGLLVGPKGQTLQAIHELSRTIVQRKATGTHHGRVRIDVAGYRHRRQEALERFATQVASEVAETGVAKALEPMHPADRKVVHDTVNAIPGVRTSSEGEEPRRRVVISPAEG